MENKFLFNDSIIVRFISLFVIGAILFTVVWYLSYYFLPEGIMQGKTGSAIIVGSDAAPTMLEEWGTIVMYNLGALLVIVLVNLIRSGPLSAWLHNAPWPDYHVCRLFGNELIFHSYGRANGTNISSIVARRAIRNDRLHTYGSCNLQPVPHCTNRRNAQLKRPPPHQSGSTIIVRTMGRNWACNCIDPTGRMA